MLFELAAETHTALDKVLAWAYARVWTLRGLQNFDHLRGPHCTYWQERGIFGAKAVPQNGTVLDLCCGDGSYTKHYYAPRASHVDGIDLDGNAINAAKGRNRARNATFFVGDVTTVTFRRTDYDAILFFSALHFITEEKRARLLAKVADCLKPDGVLIGSATLPLASLEALLSPRFEQVRLWTSDWGEGRVESYFECRQPCHGSSELRGDLSLTDENFAVAAPRGSGKNV